MPRIPVVVLLGLCAWATIVDAQANKPATVSRYAVPGHPGVIPICKAFTRTSTS